MTDPISDMLNRIRNAQAVLQPSVSIPFSELKYQIAKILEKENFVGSVEKKGKKIKKTIEIVLKYKKDQEIGGKQVSIISNLKRISKSGQRIYVGSKDIKGVRGGFGLSIISTPKGVMTGKEAKKNKVGGEILCEIW
jgi:small subunit ribosomal protein S8